MFDAHRKGKYSTSMHLDHLIVAAKDLDAGIAWVESSLGVAMVKGGKHPKMGTHNYVLRIGPSVYLEVISIDPEAPAPKRPRWFGLSDPAVLRDLDRQPRLLTWAVRTDSLNSTLDQQPGIYGEAVSMSRGAYAWTISIRPDGSLPAGGFLPTLLSWEQGGHPTAHMPDANCTLQHLTLHHPNGEWLQGQFKHHGAASLVQVKQLAPNEIPYLSATIKTPIGLRTLR